MKKLKIDNFSLSIKNKTRKNKELKYRRKNIVCFKYVNFLLYFISAEIWFYASQSWDGLQAVVLCIQRTMKLHQFLLSKSRFVIYLPEPFYYSCHWQSLLWLQPNTLIKYWNSTTRMQWLDYLQLSIKLEKFEFTKLSRQCCKWTNRLYWIKREKFVWWNSTNRVSGKNNFWIL